MKKSKHSFAWIEHKKLTILCLRSDWRSSSWDGNCTSSECCLWIYWCNGCTRILLHMQIISRIGLSMGFSWLLDWGQICWVRNFCQRHGVLQAVHGHRWKSDPFHRATIASDSLWTDLSSGRTSIGDFDYPGTKSRVFSWKSCFSTCLFYPWG